MKMLTNYNPHDALRLLTEGRAVRIGANTYELIENVVHRHSIVNGPGGVIHSLLPVEMTVMELIRDVRRIGAQEVQTLRERSPGQPKAA